MIADNIIIRDCANLTPKEVKQALAAAIGYDAWLNDKRSAKDAPVRYKDFAVHETKIGTLVVNKVR